MNCKGGAEETSDDLEPKAGVPATPMDESATVKNYRHSIRCEKCHQFISINGGRPHRCPMDVPENISTVTKKYGIELNRYMGIEQLRVALEAKGGEQAVVEFAIAVAQDQGKTLVVPSNPVDLPRRPDQGPDLGSPEYLDRIEGIFLGQAAGDALGYSIEFTSPSAIYSQAGILGLLTPERTNGKGEYLYTDDTQMAIALSEGLLDPKFNPDDYNTVAREFIQWKANHSLIPGYSRAPGGACMSGVGRLGAGTVWFRSGDPHSKGAGSVMRVFPVAAMFRDNEEMLVRVAADQAIMTHSHPTGVSASIAGAYFAAQLLKDVEPRQALDRTIDFMRAMVNPNNVDVKENTAAEIVNILEKVRQVADKPEHVAANALGSGWIAEEALAIGMWAFLQSPNDLPRVVRRASNFSGRGGSCDRDTVGAVAGAIVGAWTGKKGTHAPWSDRAENRGMLLDLSRRMNEKAQALHQLKPTPPAVTSEQESAMTETQRAFLAQSYGVRVMLRKYHAKDSFYGAVGK